MPSLKLNTLKAVAEINGKEYPMYTGYLTATQLKSIATVPSFSDSKAHHAIAQDLIRPPVDEWQRPLNPGKKNKIKEIYNRTDHDNLMANPVLLGVAITNINHIANLNIIQKQIILPDGTSIDVDDNFIITINYDEINKPIWILDGQHRIEGISESIQNKEPMPLVLLYDDNAYEPKDLAEIFTQVTAGATPMESIHSEWMQYAFELENYTSVQHKNSLDTVIYLCKESSFHSVNNPFQNKIQFNPYMTKPSYYAFELDMKEWEKIIFNEYYSDVRATLTPIQLAGEIVKAVKAFEELDAYKYTNGSKIFSAKQPFKSLAEGFLHGLLRYLANHNCIKSFDEWKLFLDEKDRAFSKCDWRFKFVKTPGALSSSNGVPSKKIAKDCFDDVFNNIGSLGGALLTDFMQGVNSEIKISIYKKTPSGNKSKTDVYEHTISPTGLAPCPLSKDGIQRSIIDIEPAASNTSIIKVTDENKGKIASELPIKNLDVELFPDGYEIEIYSMNYSGDTTKVTTLRLDR